MARRGREGARSRRIKDECRFVSVRGEASRLAPDPIPFGSEAERDGAQPDDELPQGSFVGGVVMLFKDADPDAYELFAWVRRPHRASGLGTSASAR